MTLETFLKPLLLTILLECIVAFILGLRNKDLILVVMVNIITNPPLVYICLALMYYLGVDKAYLITYLILEPIVIIVEWLIYRQYLNKKTNYLLLSIILNVVSIIGGLIC